LGLQGDPVSGNVTREAMNSESIYRLIFENVNDGVLLRDANTLEIIDVNPRFCELYGVSRDEILASRPGLGSQGSLSALKRLASHFKMAKEGRPQTFEWQILRKDGSRIWAEINLRTATIEGRACFLSVIRDISDRKQIEQELLESRERFYNALESITDIFFIVDNQWAIQYANGEFERVTKKSRDMLLGKNLWETLPLMEGTIFHDNFLRAISERTPMTFEARAADKYWVEVGIYPSSEGLSIYLKDIAKRKDAEQALRQAEQRYRAIFENSPEGIYQTTLDGRFIAANPACARLLGYESPDELISAVRNIGIQIYADPGKRGEVLRLLKKNGKIQGFEAELRHRDGHILWVSITGQSVCDEQGEVVAIQGALRDVSEIKKANAAREQSELRYRELVENANSIIMRRNPEGKISYFNEYAQKFFGFTEDEIIGKHVVGTIVPETDSAGQDLRQLIDVISHFPENYTTSENENIRKDGERVWISWTNKPIYNDDGALRELLCVGNDATERKKLEEQLRHAQKMEAVGTLAGGIAHDFNNILAVMIGNIELADDDASEETRHHLRQALNAGLRGRDTIRQILTFSRKGEQKTKILHLIPLLSDLVKMLRPSFPTTIEISLNIGSDRDTVRADPTQIQQVIMNLCTNAKDAMSPAGGLLEISLEERQLAAPPEIGMRPGRYVVLSVRDTGQGIDDVVKRRIFEPFFTTKDPGRGTGMGLALVYSVIRGLNGAIEVRSEPGKGSTFTIHLPSIQHRASAYVSSAELPLYRGSESILFVDDEERQVETAKRTIESLGYNVTAVTNSTEALELFCRNPGSFDLVITDQMMPLMSGTTLAKHILSIRADIPIIVITGFSETVSPRTAHAHGIRELAMKPLVKRELAETIRRALDQQDRTTS
jgi:PAS domain S-box-containing protein